MIFISAMTHMGQCAKYLLAFGVSTLSAVKAEMICLPPFLRRRRARRNIVKSVMSSTSSTAIPLTTPTITPFVSFVF